MSQSIRDEEFLEGVLSRRCVAWAIDALAICLIWAVLWMVLALFMKHTFR